MSPILAYFANFNIIAAIVFIVGIALLVVEMFLPGFGVSGVLGITAIIIGIILQAKSILEAFILVLIFLSIGIVLLVFIARSFIKGRLSKSSLVLTSQKPAQDRTEIKAGDTGLALSDLRPAGVGQFGDKRVDVLTRGEFLQKGDGLRVLEVEQYKVIVAKNQEETK